MSDFNITASALNKKRLENQRKAITRFFRAAMARQGLRFRDLPDKLQADAQIEISEVNLRSKINNGTLSADLFLTLCEVMGETDPLGEIGAIREKLESDS